MIDVTNLVTYSLKLVAQTSPLDYITTESAIFIVTVHENSCKYAKITFNDIVPDQQETEHYNDYQKDIDNVIRL